MTVAELTQCVLDLTPEERLTLVETLWDSIDQGAADLPLRDWQKQLLDERLEEAERDPDVWVEWDEVETEIRAALAGTSSPPHLLPSPSRLDCPLP